MTLWQFILNALIAAGYTEQDVNSVEYRHPDYDSYGEDGWIHVQRGQFKAIAEGVQAGAVHADKRERLRFQITTRGGDAATFAWDNDTASFQRVTPPPRVHTLTSDDLTTGA